MRRISTLLPILVLLFACGEENDTSTQITIEKAGAGGTSSAGNAGEAGSDQAGSGQGLSGSSGQSGANGGAGLGAGGSDAGSGGSGAGSGGDAGSGQAGAGGGEVGGSEQVGGSSGTSGQGGDAGSGGAPVEPSVAFVKPADGAEVMNPVAFSLKAEGVTSVGLVADDLYSLPLTWDPKSSSTHDFTYDFSTMGKRSLVLSGYVDGQATAAATASIQITVVNPAGAICEGATGLSFQPPKVCDKLSGNTTSEIPTNGYFSTSWFGCYFKGDGSIYKDPGDNCEFACGNKGLCNAGWDGPTCEANLKWFAADADRYGCGGRIRVTNCANGKSVVLATLDKGPNCASVEQKYGAPVLDMSHDAMVYLFDGKTYGGSDKKGVIVEKVDATTALGPIE